MICLIFHEIIICYLISIKIINFLYNYTYINYTTLNVYILTNYYYLINNYYYLLLIFYFFKYSNSFQISLVQIRSNKYIDFNLNTLLMK